MATQEKPEIADAYKLGDRVKIKHYLGNPGKIVELRGALGPNGAKIYRVLIPSKPTGSYIELRGDQLEPLNGAATAKKSSKARKFAKVRRARKKIDR